MEGLQFSRTALTDQTSMTFLGGLILLVLIVLVVKTGRKNLFFPFLLLSLFVSQGQRIAVGGIDFSLIRILTLVAFLRTLFKKELRHFRPSPLDRPFFAWLVFSVVIFVLREKTSSAFIFAFGRAVDNALLYIVFRTSFDSIDDVFAQMRKLSLLLIPVFLFFILERSTGRNVFSFFGGVPAITVVRAGRLRCQGSFAHPIIGGVFVAGFVPLLYAAWRMDEERRKRHFRAILLSLGIVYLSASSTPVVSIGLFVVGMLMWFVRKRRKLFFPAIMGMLVGLSFFMDSPVYHLISRIDLTGGSTGWHRYYLIHQAVTNFREWALLGVSTTRQWGATLFDVTNQYVLEGVRGGIISMVFFIACIAVSFRRVGEGLSRASDKKEYLLFWCLGVSMFQHVMNMFAVSYYGEAMTLFLFHLALIGSLVPKEELERTGEKLLPANSPATSRT